MLLLRKDTEHHVVATATNTRQILSIPIMWDGKVEILGNQNLDKLFRSLLPPIYPLVNTTWDLKEPGRCDLQLNMREVAQPLVEILEDWPRSKEGKSMFQREFQQRLFKHMLFTFYGPCHSVYNKTSTENP